MDPALDLELSMNLNLFTSPVFLSQCGSRRGGPSSMVLELADEIYLYHIHGGHPLP